MSKENQEIDIDSLVPVDFDAVKKEAITVPETAATATVEPADPQSQEETEGGDGDGKAATLFTHISSALKGEGIFQGEYEVKDAKDFAKAIKSEIESKVEERVKRVEKALENNVPTDNIKFYEDTLATLDGITPAQLEAEANAEACRSILLQSYIEAGMAEDKARRFLALHEKEGTLVSEAKEALNDLRKIYSDKYDTEVKAGEQRIKEAKEKQIQEYKDFEKALNDNSFINGLTLTEQYKRKVLDAMNKQTEMVGNQKATVLEKYANENPTKFKGIVSTLYVLTKGFTDFSELGKSIAAEHVTKQTKGLEDVIKNIALPTQGSLVDDAFREDFDKALSKLKPVF